MANVEDRWHRYVSEAYRDEEGRTRRRVVRDGKGRKKVERTARFGQGQRWRVRYRGPDRVERTRTFKTKDEAERFARRVEVSKDEGTFVDPVLGRTRFGDWAGEWLAAVAPALKPKTAAGYRSLLRTHVLPAFGHLELARVRPVDVRRFVGQLIERGLSASRVRSTYFLLGSIMEAAVESGYVGRSPCVGVKLPRATTEREPAFLTAEQVAAIADAVPDRDKALVYVLAYGGLRWGEAAALRRRRVNVLKGRLEVAESLAEVDGTLIFGTTKTHQARTVALPRSVMSMLADHLDRFVDDDPDALVFTSTGGGPLRSPNWRRRVWLPGLDGAGLPPVRVHDLRHTCASLLIAAGTHPKQVQAHLGHSSIQVTFDRYGHLFPDQQDELASALDRTFQRANGNTVQ